MASAASAEIGSISVLYSAYEQMPAKRRRQVELLKETGTLEGIQIFGLLDVIRTPFNMQHLVAEMRALLNFSCFEARHLNQIYGYLKQVFSGKFSADFSTFDFGDFLKLVFALIDFTSKQKLVDRSVVRHLVGDFLVAYLKVASPDQVREVAVWHGEQRYADHMNELGISEALFDYRVQSLMLAPSMVSTYFSGELNTTKTDYVIGEALVAAAKRCKLPDYNNPVVYSFGRSVSLFFSSNDAKVPGARPSLG